MLLDSSMRSILRRTCNGLPRGKLLPLKEESSSLSGWAEVSSNYDMVVRSFKKCGISLLLDGSENGNVHIESIEEFPTANEITEFQLESESENEDDEEDDYEIDHDNESSDDSNV